jgi:hypothetical protein
VPEEIPVASTKSIRECGLDELWLQDQIANNPSCLDLGDLELVSREQRHPGGGRLDILFKGSDDDAVMYEVEVMLGETDEKHIIHTIEYWDREKRRWPQRQHFAVLVAESITRRFFNVIHLLSHCIPIIAVQANVVDQTAGECCTSHECWTPTRNRLMCRNSKGRGMNHTGKDTHRGLSTQPRPCWTSSGQPIPTPR